MSPDTPPAPVIGQVLHWSAAWAALVGGDGPIITDLLGRIGPGLTDQHATQLRAAEWDAGRTRLERAGEHAWAVAARDGLQTALACARQSAERVIDSIAPYDRTSGTNDRWARWQPAQRALAAVCSALVIRRSADPDLIDTLAGPWVQVWGPLPEYVELDTSPAGQRCGECRQVVGVAVVSEAEAARAARHILAGREFGADLLREQLATARRTLAEHTLAHPSWDVVRGLLRVALADAPGLSRRARRHIEDAFGIKPPAGEEGPVQNGLFGVGEVSRGR